MTVGLWDSVTGFFEDLGDFFSGKDFFECAGYAWNDMMQLASDVLTKNPAKGTYKDVWESISTIYTTLNVDRKSTRLNSSHNNQSRMPSSA